jgi:hypothetical protein
MGRWNIIIFLVKGSDLNRNEESFADSMIL